MSPRAALLVALALLAGCAKTSTRPGIRLNGPSAVAVFHGLTTRDPAALRAYLAVANQRGDDLRILDAVDGKAVLAPGLIMSLSVPTEPRPSLLAAGGLADGSDGARADLLAVAPAGLVSCNPVASAALNGCIQVVATWDVQTAVASSLTIDLTDHLPAGETAEVLSLAVVPVPESTGPGTWRASAGKARLVAGLSGQRLLLADYARAPDGVAIVLSGVAVHQVGFDAVSLAGAPDQAHLYAASPDPIGGVEGVAELDLSLALDQLPALRALPAGGPTTAVLAATLLPFVGITADATLDQFGTEEVTRVYAALDPTRCGRDREVTCGLVILDPVTRAPLEDPAHELPAHAPIAVPGGIRSLVAVYPPAVGSAGLDGVVPADGTPGVLQKQANQTGYRWASTLAVATSTKGSVYLVDLARGELALEAGVLATSAAGTQARVGAASASTPPVTGQPWLALWDERSTVNPPTLTHDAASLIQVIGITPGYTTSDTWILTWQAALPNLSAVQAQLQSTATLDGLAWLAVQSSSGATADVPPYRGVARLYDPRLAIQPRLTDTGTGQVLRPGDIAVVTPADTTACPGGAFELEVTDLLPPTPDHPGGAVAVRPADLQPSGADYHCLDRAGRSTATVSFLSGGLLLTGVGFGYAGRPVAQAVATDPGFSLAWEDTTALSCPMLDGSDFMVAGQWQPPTCDAACRDQCERILLGRKSRRVFYLSEQCPALDTECTTRWGTSALLDPTGPVLRFKAGWAYPAGSTGTAAPARDTLITFTTASGLVPMARWPQVGGSTTGAVLPSGLATFDRAGTTKVAADGIRVFVSYPSNEVLDFSPSQVSKDSTIHR